MLTGRPGKTLRDFKLWKDYDALIYFSYYYTTKEATEKLASYLLDGKQPGGGVGFISNRVKNGEYIEWPAMAINVAKHAYLTSHASDEGWTGVLVAALSETISDNGKYGVEQYVVNGGKNNFFF